MKEEIKKLGDAVRSFPFLSRTCDVFKKRPQGLSRRRGDVLLEGFSCCTFSLAFHTFSGEADLKGLLHSDVD
jgi:hypothetical protein